MDIVVQTYGTAISRDNETFIISNKDGKRRIPPDGIASFQISKGVQITSDAIFLAIEKEIEILFIDKSGTPKGRVWSPKFGSISTIRKGQLLFIRSKKAIDLIKQLLNSKIENQQAMLLMMNAPAASQTGIYVNQVISQLDGFKEKIISIEGERIGDVSAKFRGWEGYVSKKYFECLNLFLPEKFRFERRSQHPALDVVNAMLNYGYGVLYGKIEGMLIKVGIDPYAGILHRDEYNRPVLVYDLIEKYRVWVDYIVYSLVIRGAITEESYSTKEDGSYWLEGLGRRILIQSLNDYMDEVVTQNGVSRSRETQMFLFIQNIAQEFKNFKS